MRIRPLVLVTMIALLIGRTAIAQIAPADSAKPESIERLFLAADMERTHERALEASLADQLKANPAMSAYAHVVRSFTMKHGSFAALKPDLMKFYRQTFPESEIKELITFVQSDFGRRYLTKSAALAQLTMQATSERMRVHLPELTAAMQAAMSPPE